MNATIFLRTALFSFKSDGHIPRNTAVVTGEVLEVEHPKGGVMVSVSEYRDADNKVLEGTPRKLFLPWAKVDHLSVDED